MKIENKDIKLEPKIFKLKILNFKVLVHDY